MTGKPGSIESRYSAEALCRPGGSTGHGIVQRRFARARKQATLIAADSFTRCEEIFFETGRKALP
jgi:hypothetical protein